MGSALAAIPGLLSKAAPIVGAGASIASAFGSGGGSSGRVASLNPATNIFNKLFGAGFGRKAGFQDDPFNEGLFEEQAFEDSIRDFIFNPQGLFPSEQAFAENFLNDPSLIGSALDDTLGLFDTLIDRGLETTDASPFFDEANRRLMDELLPQIRETAGGLSGFGEQGARAGAGLFGRAAELGVGLEESAKNRIPLLAQLGGARLAIPFSAANDVLGLGSNIRGIEAGNQARPLEAFLRLAGLGGNQSFVQEGFNTQNSTSDILSAIGENAGTLAGGVSGLFDAFGGSGGQSPSASNLEFFAPPGQSAPRPAFSSVFGT